MSQVKHKARGYLVPHADWHEVGGPMDRAAERAGPEDVGQQALMRGLDTAFPFVVWGPVERASRLERSTTQLTVHSRECAVAHSLRGCLLGRRICGDAFLSP